MCGYQNAYEGTWRHVAYAHVNMYFVLWRYVCGQAFRSLGEVRRQMAGANCELVYAPEETWLDQTRIAFKNLIGRVKERPVEAPWLEPLSEDELDYEDLPTFTPSAVFQQSLTPVATLDCQMEKFFGAA